MTDVYTSYFYSLNKCDDRCADVPCIVGHHVWYTGRTRTAGDHVMGIFGKKRPNLIQLLLEAFSSTSSLETYLEILSWTQIMASRLNQVLYGRSCAYKMQNTEMKLSRLAERSGEEFVFSLHLLKMFNGLTCLQYPIIAIVLLVDAP